MAKRTFLPATASAGLHDGAAAPSRTLIEQTSAAPRTDIIEGRLEPGS